MDDITIITLLKENRDEGLVAAIDKYLGLVTTIVKRVLYKYPEDIDECISDAFIKLWKSSDQLKEDCSSIKPYLICIARNTAITRYNQLKKKQELSLDDNFEYYLADNTDIEQEVLTGESIDLVLEVMETFPEPNKEIMHRRFFLLEPIKEIAKALSLTDSMVANRIQYYKEKLSKTLTERGVSL